MMGESKRRRERQEQKQSAKRATHEKHSGSGPLTNPLADGSASVSSSRPRVPLGSMLVVALTVLSGVFWFFAPHWYVSLMTGDGTDRVARWCWMLALVSVFGLRRCLTVCPHESLDVSTLIMILFHPGDVGIGVGGLWINRRWWSTGIGRCAKCWAAHRSAR